MVMEVMLMSDVAELGTEGQIVNVSDGYARNYLLPRKLAAPATEAAKKRLAKKQKEREVSRKMEIDAAKVMAEKIANASCTLTVKTAGTEKMYGSVTAADIVASLKEQGIEIDKHMIKMDAPLKELGVFNVKVSLHPEVESSVKVWIVEE